MNLYLVVNPDNWDDTYESFVCASPTQSHAREMHPSNPLGEWPEKDRSWITRKQTGRLKVVFLGRASKRFYRPEIIHTSYNRG